MSVKETLAKISEFASDEFESERDTADYAQNVQMPAKFDGKVYIPTQLVNNIFDESSAKTYHTLKSETDLEQGVSESIRTRDGQKRFWVIDEDILTLD